MTKDNVATNDPEKSASSVSEFLSIIGNLLDESSHFIFRGHASDKWELKPSIWRNNGNNISIEYSMLNEFKRLHYPYTLPRPLKKIDLLFLAQHYRMPTRLLDWTTNPLIALFFACNEEKNNDGIIFVKNISCESSNKDVNHKTFQLECNDDDIDPFTFFENEKNSNILVPDNTDIRFYNQQCVFEVFRNYEYESKVLKTIIIPKKHKSDIIKFLSVININELFVYPDLEHLTKHIKNKYLQNTDEK